MDKETYNYDQPNYRELFNRVKYKIFPIIVGAFAGDANADTLLLASSRSRLLSNHVLVIRRGFTFRNLPFSGCFWGRIPDTSRFLTMKLLGVFQYLPRPFRVCCPVQPEAVKRLTGRAFFRFRGDRFFLNSFLLNHGFLFASRPSGCHSLFLGIRHCA